MIKIVITGASGFLGSNLIKRLENEKDVTVYALSSKNLKASSANVISVHKDIIDRDDAEDVFKDAVVVNCAFPRNVTGVEMANGLAYINRLFMTCKKYNAKVIINISSQSVYSQKRTVPADEETKVCLETPYAVGKYATELMLESTCEGSEIAYTNVRMASLIGPEFDQRIINRLVKKALALEPITISVSDQRFGFLDVYDAVEAVVSLIVSDRLKWSKIYNVGNGAAVSLTDIIDVIGVVFKENNIPMPNISYVQEEKSGSSAVTYQRIHDETGYTPKINLLMSTKRILINAQRGS